MASQFKKSISWGHNVAESPEKASRIIELSKNVAKSEHDESSCGMYAVLSPLEDQKFSQPERLEIIMSHDEGHLQQHQKSGAVDEFNKTVEKEHLLSKPESKMSFTTLAGFAHRGKPSQTPPKEHFIWIAKLDCHSGKFDEFVAALKTHADNVERTEDGTLSFLVLQSHDTENSVTLFERYISEDYFRNTHHNSKNMEEHSCKLKPLLAERVVAGFQLVAGFVDKNEPLV